MEIMGLDIFSGIYKNKKILVTGHSGFKGSWLSLWLASCGADIIGYALPPATNPAHYEHLNFQHKTYFKDIRDYDSLLQICRDEKIEFIFHLAAQSLVRESYINPRETFDINLKGMVNVLEVARHCDNVKGVICVTSDKCYDFNKIGGPAVEDSPLGGNDPYSASKGCCEIIVNSYRHSFFCENNCLVASVRAGNVIGGGDWAKDRLIPDIVRASVEGKSVAIRYPKAIRPWQYVLEAVCAYLLLGVELLKGKKEFACAWNIAPDFSRNVCVEKILKIFSSFWSDIRYHFTDAKQFFEEDVLLLDASKSYNFLSNYSVCSVETVVRMTVDWYRDYYENKNIDLTERSIKDIKTFISQLG